MYDIFTRSIEVNSKELLVFVLSRDIIPVSKYHKYIKILVGTARPELFSILINKISDKFNYNIQMVIACLKNCVKVTNLLDVLDDGSIILKLINNEKLLDLLKIQIGFNFNLVILKQIKSLKLFTYYIDNIINDFSCDTYLIKLKDHNKLNILFKSNKLKINNIEMISYHLLNLSYYDILNSLILIKVDTISDLLLSKIKKRKLESFISLTKTSLIEK
jgi:hypothetical protein